MENNEVNSAVEKVETVSKTKKTNKDTAVKPNVKKTTTTKKNPVKRTKTVKTESVSNNTKTKNNDKSTVKAQKDEKRKANQIKRAEAEKRRVEKAEKRKKQEVARRQALQRKRELLAAERLRRKEERIARRDMLKSESAEARKERLASERQEKLRLKREKAQIRAKLISEKRENARILKQQKREQRAANKTEKRSRGIGGWLAAVISLACSTLILGTLFTFNLLYMSNGNALLNSSYERAYYDLVGCIDNIEVNLAKLTVSQSPVQQQKLLTDIIVESELAESELQTLPLENENKYSTSKYINQLSDYSKTLSYKIADGGAISDEDREMLVEFYNRNGNVQKTLVKISEEMGGNYSFLSLLKSQEDDKIISNMTELENNSLEYPKMIYDGPFSDGLETKEVRGLKGSEVTKSDALTSFKQLFADYAVMDAEIINEAEGDISTYNVCAKTESGGEIYAQMSKREGRLVLFNCYEECEEEKFTLDECREIAEVFVKKAGFENMKPVWETSSRAVAQFNFAVEENGVVVYPDLVKVNVCMERGLVSAVEASSYFYNHTERTIPEAKISKEQAEDMVSSILSVQTIRKAIVPVGNGKEKLAYEVFATAEGDQYFIYVDAITGKELEIFKVIESTEGRLLL